MKNLINEALEGLSGIPQAKSIQVNSNNLKDVIIAVLGMSAGCTQI